VQPLDRPALKSRDVHSSVLAGSIARLRRHRIVQQTLRGKSQQPRVQRRGSFNAEWFTSQKRRRDIYSVHDPDGLTVELQFKNTKSWYVLDPRTTFMVWWDSLIPMLLLFTATVTPFEVGFLEPAKSASNTIFIINRVVDAGFIVDVIVNLFLGYKLSGTSLVVFNHWQILKRYLGHWFVVDVVSVLPFDTVALFMDTDHANIRTASRSLRLLRLLKLLRLLRMARVLERMKSSFGISYLQISMIKYFLVVLLTVHWTACGWGIVGSITIEAGPGESWVI